MAELSRTANTGTGDVLERMVLPALDHGGYIYECRKLVDLLIQDHTGNVFLASLKWQQRSGTAEQKVPFEVICLAEAVNSSKGAYTKAYLVLGGSGWTLKQFYVKGGLKEHLRNCDDVTILALDDFVALATRRRL